MAFYRQDNPSKRAAANTDSLLVLADLLMKIDQREKVISIPDSDNDGVDL